MSLELLLSAEITAILNIVLFFFFFFIELFALGLIACSKLPFSSVVRLNYS